MEALAHRHRVLAGHGVRHQENLFGFDLGPDGLQLFHQRGVDVEAPGGVQDHRVKARGVGRFHGGPGNGHRVLGRLAGVHCHPDVGPQALELLDGRGPLHVRGHQIRLLPLALEAPGQLGRGGGLAGALQAHQHHGHRRFAAQIQPGRLPAQQRRQLLVDDLDDLLGRGQRPHDLFPHRPLPDALDEGLGDLIIDVGFEKRQAHLAQGLPHLGLGELAPAFELLEDGVQLVG